MLTPKRRFKIYGKNLEAIFLPLVNPFLAQFSFFIYLDRGAVELI